MYTFLVRCLIFKLNCRIFKLLRVYLERIASFLRFNLCSQGLLYLIWGLIGRGVMVLYLIHLVDLPICGQHFLLYFFFILFFLSVQNTNSRLVKPNHRRSRAKGDLDYSTRPLSPPPNLDQGPQWSLWSINRLMAQRNGFAKFEFPSREEKSRVLEESLLRRIC